MAPLVSTHTHNKLIHILQHLLLVLFLVHVCKQLLEEDSLQEC